jgi:eukaryotic-like serine/threonine-protein kinase
VYLSGVDAELLGPFKVCGILLCAAFVARKAFSVRVQGEHSGIAQPISESPKASWPTFSPDGKYVSFCDDTKVQKYDVAGGQLVTIANPKWLISAGGGTRASWRRDGKELYYLSPDAKLMAVPVTRTGDNLNFGKPVELFQGPFELTGSGNVGRPYDPSADGQKFVMNSAVETTAQPLTIVTNWTSLLKK